MSQETLKEKTSCQCTTAHCDDLDVCVEVVYNRSRTTNDEDMEEHSGELAKMTLYAAYGSSYRGRYHRYRRRCRVKLGTRIGPYQLSSDVTGGKWKSSYVGIPLKCQASKVCIVYFILCN